MAFDEDDDAVPHFTDQGEALSFWRERAESLRTTLRDTELTLKEFEESSRELEKEMESELNAANGKVRDVQVRAEKLKGDVDEWKGKYQRSLSDHNKTLAELNRELSMLRESHNVYKSKLRDMELDNDELENAERMVASSLTDMEARYNRAIERTALLEEELVAKTRLEEENQRLKDELQELKEELAVWQDKVSRPATRASDLLGQHATNASVRSSLDIERYRPGSRASVDRPLSRASGTTGRSLYSPTQGHAALPAASSSSSTASSSTAHRRPTGALFSHRATLGSHSRRDSADVRQPGSEAGLSSSPSSVQLKHRQSLGPSAAAAASRPSTSTMPSSTSSARLHSRPTLGARPARSQQGASMRKMAGLLQNLRDLQATVHSATRINAADATASAIPRPSSRLSSSIGAGGAATGGTPRRSIDVRRDEQGTPSAIPVPANGLSRSTSHRPPSRLSMPVAAAGQKIPSSVRSQTPNLELYDFLDQDPATQQFQLRRRSQIALGPSSTNINAATINPLSQSITAGGGGAGAGGASGARPRGSTISSNLRRDEPLRNSVHPRTGKPAPPPVSLRQTTTTMSRQRSSSFGSNAN